MAAMGPPRPRRRMRGFSSGAHCVLIGHAQDELMPSSGLSRGASALLLVAVLLGGVVLGGAVAALAQVTGSSPTPSPTATPEPTPTVAELPTSDVDGEDLPRLPRYPGSVRTDHEVSIDDRYRLTALEYLADAGIEEVRGFYQNVMDAHGWDRADVNYTSGEWTYVLVDGRIEALIEIELWNGLVEIDLQISEPIESPSPSPSPSPPSPSPSPSAPPPPPPAPPSPTDDDDDDDHGGGDDDDTWDPTDTATDG